MGKKKKRSYESEEDSEKETKKKNKKKGTGKKYVIEKKKTKTKEKKSRNKRREASYDSSQSEGRNRFGNDYKYAKKKKKKVTTINVDNKSDENNSDDEVERVSGNSSKNGDRHYQNKTAKKGFFKKFIWVYIIFIAIIVIIGIANYQYIIEVIQNIKTPGEVTTASETNMAKPDPQKTPGASAVVSENPTKESKKETTKEKEEKAAKEQEVRAAKEKEEKAKKEQEERAAKEQEEKAKKGNGNGKEEKAEKEKELPINTTEVAEEYQVSTGEDLPEMEKLLSETKPVPKVVHDDRIANFGEIAYSNASIHPGRILRSLHALDLSTEGEMAKINEEKKEAPAFIELSCLNESTMTDGKVTIDRKEQDHIDEMNKMNATFFMFASAQSIMRSRNKKAPLPISDDLNETTITHFRNKTKVEKIKRDVNENENEDIEEDVEEDIEEDVAEEKKEIIIPPEVTPLFEPIAISLESNENPNYLYYCNIPPRHVTEKLIFQFFREQRKKKKILYFSTSIDFNEVAFKLKTLEETAVEEALNVLKPEEIFSSEEDSGFFNALKKKIGYKIIKSFFTNRVIKNAKRFIGFKSEEEKSKESTSTMIKRFIKIALICCVVQFIIVYFMCSCVKGIFKMVVTSFCRILIFCCCGGKGKKKKSTA